MALDGGGIMKKKILLKAPLLTRSGYGEQSRFALRSLRSREDLFDIYIQPLQWGQTSWMTVVNEERKWIDAVIEKTIAYVQQGGLFDVSLQVTIPNEWEHLAPINIGYTAGIETTKVAPQWIVKANEIDSIITISSHSKQVFKNTEYLAQNEALNQEMILKLNTPIEYVNYPVKTYENLPALDLDLEYDINFAAVAQFSPRKNLPDTLKWFVEEFHDDEVGFVVKSNLAKNCFMDREKLFLDMKGFLANYPDRKCKIYLLHGDMTDEEVHAIYHHPKIRALVALPHGEGFGLPIYEAAYSNLPVVATGWSGHLDFLVDEEGKEQFYNVAYDLQPVQDAVVWDGVIMKDSMWAYSRESSAKEQMRQCYEDITNDVKRFENNLLERFNDTKMYETFVNAMNLTFDDEEEIEEWLSNLDAEEYE